MEDVFELIFRPLKNIVASRRTYIYMLNKSI